MPGTHRRSGKGGRPGFNPHEHNNAGRGRRAEARVKKEYESRGWKMRRNGEGADFKATRGKRTLYVEVKTGSGKMNPSQKALRKRVGRDNYRVEWRATRRTTGKDWSTTGKKRSGRAGRRGGGSKTRRKGGGFTWS